jgi:hypothetical protein
MRSRFDAWCTVLVEQCVYPTAVRSGVMMYMYSVHKSTRQSWQYENFLMIESCVWGSNTGNYDRQSSAQTS